MITESELDVLELCACGAMTDSWYTKTTSADDATAAFIAAASPDKILELIAELRQAWKERDWLARQLDFENCCVPSDLTEDPGYCLEHECVECGLSSAGAWLDAAKEATKNE